MSRLQESSIADGNVARKAGSHLKVDKSWAIETCPVCSESVYERWSDHIRDHLPPDGTYADLWIDEKDKEEYQQTNKRKKL